MYTYIHKYKLAYTQYIPTYLYFYNIYIYVCMYVCIHIHIYIERERERKLEGGPADMLFAAAGLLGGRPFERG